MYVPESLIELQRFLGMVNYLDKFIPNLVEVTAQLQSFWKRAWFFICRIPAAIEKLKTLITSAPILNVFYPNLPRRLKIDASSEGLGAVLKQNHGSLENPQWHPIGYLSRTLCDYEKLYAQIEEEILSINFGVKHFRKYLHGRKFTIVNDYRPLKLIFSRSMVRCPFRIQKCFLQFQKYDFQLEYAPGKKQC